METKQRDLDNVAERLGALGAAEMALGNAVRRARLSGASWAEIGEALGVTRQAAQQRFRTVNDGDCICPLDPDDDALLAYQANCPCHG